MSPGLRSAASAPQSRTPQRGRRESRPESAAHRGDTSRLEKLTCSRFQPDESGAGPWWEVASKKRRGLEGQVAPPPDAERAECSNTVTPANSAITSPRPTHDPT